jgi:hypothetical protein
VTTGARQCCETRVVLSFLKKVPQSPRLLVGNSTSRGILGE